MTDFTLAIRITGIDATAVAQDLRRTLDAAGAGATVNPFTGPSLEDLLERRGDPAVGLAVASVVLAVPSAWLAARDLASRKTSRARAEQVDNEILRLKLTHKDTEFELELRGGKDVVTVALGQLAEVLEGLRPETPADG